MCGGRGVWWINRKALLKAKARFYHQMLFWVQNHVLEPFLLGSEKRIE
jgi:hypothetical protein